jgi:hypothetical protein
MKESSAKMFRAPAKFSSASNEDDKEVNHAATSPGAVVLWRRMAKDDLRFKLLRFYAVEVP